MTLRFVVSESAFDHFRATGAYLETHGKRGRWARTSPAEPGGRRKVQTDWEAWCRRSLAEEPVVRLILDVTVVRVRLDRKATSISLLVVLGIRRDGQKMLLAVRRPGIPNGEPDGRGCSRSVGDIWRTCCRDAKARSG